MTGQFSETYPLTVCTSAFAKDGTFNGLSADVDSSDMAVTGDENGMFLIAEKAQQG